MIKRFASVVGLTRLLPENNRVVVSMKTEAPLDASDAEIVKSCRRRAWNMLHIKLTQTDGEILAEYKENHPELNTSLSKER